MQWVSAQCYTQLTIQGGSEECVQAGAAKSGMRQGAHRVNFPALTKNSWKPSSFGRDVKYFLVVLWNPFSGSLEC